MNIERAIKNNETFMIINYCEDKNLLNSFVRENVTALDLAAEYGSHIMVHMMLKYGADAKKTSVLCSFMKNKNPDRRILKLLLDYGAKIDAKDENGKTATELAELAMKDCLDKEKAAVSKNDSIFFKRRAAKYKEYIELIEKYRKPDEKTL